MIINDLTLLVTKLEVWKAYLNTTPTEESNDLINQLNTILLQPVTPESLQALEDFIKAREA
jgi:hypothetical protein